MAETPDFKSSLNLPQTTFPMKANLAQLEPKLLARWIEQDLYRKLMELNAKQPIFCFHDGPPYANGNIHQGHFLNKILKDIVARYKNAAGFLCDFVPGWDCHGLPIELNVDKELGSKKKEMDKVQIRQACRAYAQKFVEIQKVQFQRLGVMARWDQPYLTMSHDYEAQTVRELAKFARAGSLYRGKKPVHWCMSDRTALAEAEVEYEEHTSPTIYVAFPVVGDLSTAIPALKGRAPELVIWTTTPWTLPANLAISVHPDFTYVAYDLHGRVIVVAKELLTKFLAECAPEELALKEVPLPATDGTTHLEAATLADPARILGYCEGKALEGTKYRHVFIDRTSPVILGEHVTLEAGTGLVHTAPGHGADDYQVGLKYGLQILAPVDAAGRYTDEAGAWLGQVDEAGKWVGLKVLDANPLIIAKLVETKTLLSDPKATFKHQYPVCWRCHKPIIFRATDQWFISMEKTGLREACLTEIDKVRWIPSWGRDRIHGMLENRPDWCISRQRTWGVPIAVVYCAKESCHEALVDPALMDRAADAMEKEGADAWYAHPVSDFVAPGQTCAKCGGTEFRRETDILDVWFDSGTSYAAVAEKRPNLRAPVDLYLEGSDQHRGWFHSSLMCSVGTRGHAPYKTVLTHGFVVDGKGEKFSKSKKNYTEPEKLVEKWGAEVIRLWVAASDYRDDIRSSEAIFDGLSDGYRKIRNTLRYALSNLGDFDPAKDRVADADLLPLDRWARGQLAHITARILGAYDAYEFHLVYHSALDFCANTLSATYFDVLKDRLYTFKTSGVERRAAQTVLYDISVDLLRLLAPILAFTCDEAWVLLPGTPAASVILAGLPKAGQYTADAEIEARFAKLLEVRRAVLPALEVERQNKLIGSSLEAKVTLQAPAEQLAFLEKNRAELAPLFIVSAVDLVASADDKLHVKVEKAPGEKCPRCWSYHVDLKPAAVCSKCEVALR